MKNYWLLLFLLSFLNLHSQEILPWGYQRLEEGETQYVYSTLANIRNGSGIEYEITDQLLQGEEVIFLGFPDSKNIPTYTNNGISAYWLPISYHKDGLLEKGYIWQGNLSINQLRRGDTKFIYGIEKIGGGSYDYEELVQYTIGIKILEQNLLKAEKKFLAQSESGDITANVFEGLGLKNIKNIIRISFNANACGIASTSYYFAWDGRNIIELPTKLNQNEAGQYHYYQELIFPLEKGGKPNKILRLSKTEEFNEKKLEYDPPKIVETEEFLWNKTNYKKIK